jgi:hypothetical protein
MRRGCSLSAPRTHALRSRQHNYHPDKYHGQGPAHTRLFSIMSAGHVLKDKVIHYLRELADETYQQRVWTGQSPAEMSSLTEAVCGLFDDSGLGDALDKGGPVFTDEIDGLFRELDVAIYKVNSSGHHSNFLQSPEMARVRRWSAHLLSLLEGQSS